MTKFLCVLGLFCTYTAFGQTFRNVRVLREEEKIVITYDLIHEGTGSKVIVTMYGSHNNFESPVTNATGNIGEVLPGPNRRVEWDIENLPENFTGNLTFQFKGEVIHGWKFLNPSNGKLKRGKKYNLKWSGGLPTDTVTLNFISPGKQIEIQGRDVKRIVKIQNTGSYKWRVPKKINTGLGYTLQLIKGKEVHEQQILIKRKTPLVIFAIPVVGAAIILGISGDDAGGDESLPDAPKPN